MKRKDLIDGAWLKTTARGFRADISDLGQADDTFACPVCRAEMLVSEVAQVHKDAEGTHWTGHCVCGVRLTIFDDSGE